LIQSGNNKSHVNKSHDNKSHVNKSHDNKEPVELIICLRFRSIILPSNTSTKKSQGVFSL